MENSFLDLTSIRVAAHLSLLSDSNQRPRDYKSRALANWAKEANKYSRDTKIRT